MKRLFHWALLVSIVLHGLLAVGVAAYLKALHRRPCSSPQLEVSHIEISADGGRDEHAKQSTEKSTAGQRSVEWPKPHEPEDDMSVSVATAGHVHPRAPSPDTTDLPQPTESKKTFNPAAKTPHQATIDDLPKPRHDIKPTYPREARRRGEHGSVTLDVLVNVDGMVDDVRVIRSSGFASLDSAAIAAVESARFTPAKANGNAVSATARLTLDFKLK